MTTVDRDTLRAWAAALDVAWRQAYGLGPADPVADGVAVHPEPATEIIRRFETGACRDTDNGKIDPEGFLSPTVIRAYSEYMQANRTLPDGSVRASDNWAAGFPLDVYMKSLWRHFLDVWEIHRGRPDDPTEALCGVLFNAMGYLHEVLKDDG